MLGVFPPLIGMVNVFMIITRNLREYGLVGIWALLAIAVANNGDAAGKPIVYTCYIVSAILLIFIVFNFLLFIKIFYG